MFFESEVSTLNFENKGLNPEASNIETSRFFTFQTFKTSSNIVRFLNFLKLWNAFVKLI